MQTSFLPKTECEPDRRKMSPKPLALRWRERLHWRYGRKRLY